MEASGRRLLLLCGFGICCAACVVLTVALNFQVPCESFIVAPTLNALLCCPQVAQLLFSAISEFLNLEVRRFIVETESYRLSGQIYYMFVHFLEQITDRLIALAL